MYTSFTGFAEGNCVAYTANLEHSQGFLCEFGYFEIVVITADDGVMSRFVNHEVKGTSRELLHFGSVHGQPLHARPLDGVAFAHDLYYRF